MATRFLEQATQQLAPVYQQSEQALQAQIPAIQNLYNVLFQGLEGQRQTETQNILESASQRGVLRSSLPVDLQTTLGQSLLAERGKLGAQQAKEVAGIQGQLGELGIGRARAIAELAGSLEGQDLERQKFEYQKINDERDYQLRVQAAKQSAASAVQKGAPAQLVGDIYSNLRAKVGQDGFVSPQTYTAHKNYWVKAGGLPAEFDETYGNFVNPVHQERFGGYY